MLFWFVLSYFDIGTIFNVLMAIVALIISLKSWRIAADAAQIKIIKNYPLLLLHLANLVYEDFDGAYPKYKGQIKTHYKIINKGELEPKDWRFDVFRKEDTQWIELKGFSFVSKKEGTLIRPQSERGPFIPSIILHDRRYDNDGLMLVKVSYTDSMDKKYCTCQYYDKGIPAGTYLNSEEERRKNTFIKFLRINGNCKPCIWEQHSKMKA